MFMSQMCSLHHVHLGQQSKMQLERCTCGRLNPLHSAEVVDSHFNFVLTTLYTHPGLIILHLVAYYLNICKLQQ